MTYSRERVDGATVDVEIIFGEDLGPLIDGPTRSIEDTPQHVLGHAEL